MLHIILEFVLLLWFIIEKRVLDWKPFYPLKGGSVGGSVRRASVRLSAPVWPLKLTIMYAKQQNTINLVKYYTKLSGNTICRLVVDSYFKRWWNIARYTNRVSPVFSVNSSGVKIFLFDTPPPTPSRGNKNMTKLHVGEKWLKGNEQKERGKNPIFSRLVNSMFIRSQWLEIYKIEPKNPKVFACAVHPLII